MCCVGGAPPRTDALIGPAACGRCPNPDSLKRRASARALSLEHGLNISWISELSGTPRSCALQRAPVRWTLTSEPTIGRSLRPCQSRNITEQRIQQLQRRAFPVTSRSSFKSPHESNRRSTLNSRGKTKPKSNSRLKTTKASIISISDWTGKIDLKAVTKQTQLFVIFCWLVKLRNRK